MAAVITGARALVKLSGDVIAFATGVSVTHELNLEEISHLDSLEVAEYAENGHRCQVTVSTIKLASNAAFAGQTLSNSAALYSLDHPTGELNQILLQPEIIIEIVDTVPIYSTNQTIVDYSAAPVETSTIVRYTETAIYTAFGAKFAGGGGEIDARGVWQGSWVFKARRGVGI